MRLRPVREDDARFLFELRNDPVVRQSALSGGPVAWEEHAAWFSGKIASAGTYIFIAEINGKKAGQIRFDVQDGHAVVDLALAQPFRGCGEGARLLKNGVACLLKEKPGILVEAHVKEDNQPSLNCFRKAGFVDQGLAVIRGSSCRRVIFKAKGRINGK